MKKIKIFILILSCLLLFLIFIVNISTEYSKKIQDIHVIGPLVKAFDISYYLNNIDSDGVQNKSKIQKNDEVVNTNINTGLDSEETKNIEKFTQQANEKLWQSLKDLDNEDLLKNISENDIKKEIITDNKDWFVIKFILNDDTSSNVFQRYYNINKKTEKIIKLGDLFKDNNYINIISEEIKFQINSQIKQNEDVAYFEDIVSQLTIMPDQNFYINNKNKLVISFDKYEIAPGFMGCIEFELHNINLN